MALRLKGSSSGYAEIDAAAVAGDVTLTLPSTTGTINVKDGSGTTNVGTGVNLGNPGANIFTISNTGGERLRIDATGAVSIPGNLNISGVLTYEDVTSVDAIGLSTFRDGLITKDVGITTITSSDINGATATDVFVYDTSKDSDGGAWRKRTSHTSWYNEEAAAGVRGSRKEFPAVAVIVAEADKVTIYDGDDPDLPMWMVINRTANCLFNTSSNATALAALNGTVCFSTDGGGNYQIRFIEDFGFRSNVTSATSTNFAGNISERHTALGHVSIGRNAIVSQLCNDVAMTVLPNAPVDSATGLPVPTIAVATDGGLSIIKDDGTVVDITNGIGNTEVAFIDGGDRLMVSRNTQTSVETGEIPTADIAASSWRHTYYNDSSVVATLGSDNAKKLVKNTSVGGNSGLSLIDENIVGIATHGLVAYATTSYNTGWMHGDIKGAFLSGISTTSMPGSNIITNGDFSNGSTGWTVQSGWTVSSGTATCDGTNGAYIYQPDTGEIPANTAITVTLTITAYTSGSIRLGSTGTSPSTLHSGTGTYSTTFVTRSSDSSGVEIYSVNFVGTIDNVIVTLAEEDRSVNNNPLQVFGTITKSAVATGADLVAYSGFSLSNYLQQPYNSDMDFGTGDFSVIGWVKMSTNTSAVFIDNRKNGNGAGFSIETIANGTVRLRTRDTSAESLTNSTKTIGDNVWHCISAVISSNGTNHKIYIDGQLDISASVTAYSVSTGQNELYFGIAGGYNAVPFDTGSLALWRISGSAPSAEQIKKMYEDEKFLFQENANATLYGSSDAVTALAYDEVTDQLHVGTSSGRSDFQGLRRINNTTQQVQTAISAHDTFIIEQ